MNSTACFGKNGLIKVQVHCLNDVIGREIIQQNRVSSSLQNRIELIKVIHFDLHEESGAAFFSNPARIFLTCWGCPLPAAAK